MNEPLTDTQPAYDIYVEEDRVTFVRRQEQVVDSTPGQAPRLAFPTVFMGAHAAIAFLSIAFAAYLMLMPASATVYALADKLPTLARVHPLPAISMSRSQSVPTTGRSHMPATQAKGLVTFYNSLTSQQVIDAGTLLVGSDGQEIVTDQDASIPAGNLVVYGHVSVWAHALTYGSLGNIKAGDIYGACCRAFIQAVNAEFTSGTNARDYTTVTKSDIDTAASGLTAQLQQSLQARLSALLSPGDTLIKPVSCTTHTASSKPMSYSIHDLQHSLAALIAGKSAQDARAILQRQGIRSVGIHLDLLRDRLPKDSYQIHVILVYH